MCSERQFFFASLDFLTVLQNVVTVEFRSLPFFARIFSCTHERRLNSGFVRHVATVGKELVDRVMERTMMLEKRRSSRRSIARR